MSAPTQEVIDLTEDASTEVETQLHRTSLSSRYPAPTTHRHGRLPRLTHEVISIDEFDEPTEASVNTQRSGSPEIELLYARPRFPTHRLAPPSTLADWRDRLARGQQPQDHHAAEGMMAGMARHIREESLVHLPHGRLLQHNIGLDEDMMFVADGPQINLPGHLDFMRQGFDMGNVPRPPPPPPTYDAPSPPREGYTRSPKEDDVLICPNCDEELGSGQSDMKKQVWVARKCGHVCTVAIHCSNYSANRESRFIAVNVQNTDKTSDDPRALESVYPNRLRNVLSKSVTIGSAMAGVFSRFFSKSALLEETCLHSARRQYDGRYFTQELDGSREDIYKKTPDSCIVEIDKYPIHKVPLMYVMKVCESAKWVSRHRLIYTADAQSNRHFFFFSFFFFFENQFQYKI